MIFRIYIYLAVKQSIISVNILGSCICTRYIKIIKRLSLMTRFSKRRNEKSKCVLVKLYGMPSLQLEVRCERVFVLRETLVVTEKHL